MLFFLFCTLVLFILITFQTTGVIPQKVWYDYEAPLNFLIFQEPKAPYTQQLVNLWVNKPWRQDGQRIPCRLELAPTVSDERTLILYQHGTGENLLTCSHFLRSLSEELMVDVVSWDYSGYGLNLIDAFERSAPGIDQTMDAVASHMTSTLQYAPDRIIVWGMDLGCGPSIRWAAIQHTPPAALILFRPLASVRQLLREHTSHDIAGWFQERWNSESDIERVTCPTLLMRGKHDSIVSPAHMAVLQERNQNIVGVTLQQIGHASCTPQEAVDEAKTFLKKQTRMDSRSKKSFVSTNNNYDRP